MKRSVQNLHNNCKSKFDTSIYWDGIYEQCSDWCDFFTMAVDVTVIAPVLLTYPATVSNKQYPCSAKPKNDKMEQEWEIFWAENYEAGQ